MDSDFEGEEETGEGSSEGFASTEPSATSGVAVFFASLEPSAAAGFGSPKLSAEAAGVVASEEFVVSSGIFKL